jgi:magnesium transporter
MEITFYKYQDHNITKLHEELAPSKWEANVDWVNIKSDDRSKVVDYLDVIPFIQANRQLIESPSDYAIPKVFNKNIIQNIIVSSIGNIYHADYISLIVLPNIIISILPGKSNFNIDRLETESMGNEFDSLGYYFSFTIISELLAQNVQNIADARKRLNQIEQQMMDKTKELSPRQIMIIRNDIGQLADIIEDQHVELNVLLSLFIGTDREEKVKRLEDLVGHYNPMNKIMIRLEEKAESIRTQYMLTQQAKSTRKINLLTIIQAIFVPLTFLAGVYGMNFQNMPELGWKYAYFVVWGIFVLLALIFIRFFKKNGWFE